MGAKFEDILAEIDSGPWTWTIFLLTSVWGLFGAMQAVSAAFLSPAIDHWCYEPQLAGLNLTQQQIKNISIPWDNKTASFASCRMYNRTYNLRDQPPVGAVVPLAPSLHGAEVPLAPSLHGWGPSDPTMDCRGEWSYDTSVFTSTITTEWGLVCSREYLRSFVQSSFMMGSFVGAPISGLLADRFGRKKLMSVALGLFIAVSLIGTVIPWFPAFLVCRFLIAMTGLCVYQSSYIIAVETCSIKHRGKVGILFSVPFALGYVLLPCLAYLIRDWRYLHLAISLPVVLLIANIVVLPESPRWLIQQGASKAAAVELQRAARWNRRKPLNPEWLAAVIDEIHQSGKQPVSSEQIELKSINNQMPHTTSPDTPISTTPTNKDTATKHITNDNPNYTKLDNATIDINTNKASSNFTTIDASTVNTIITKDTLNGKTIVVAAPKSAKVSKKMCPVSKKMCSCPVSNLGLTGLVETALMTKITLVLCVTWITCTMVYYGIAMNADNLSADPFLYMVLGGLVELPCYIFGAPIVEKFGRRATLVASLLLTGLTILGPLAVPSADKSAWGFLTVVMVGKMSITAGFQVLYLYTSELYPTCIRTQGLGITSMVGRCGGIISPFINDLLGEVYWALPSLIFGCCSVVAGCLTCLLPETKNQELPDTIQEMQACLDRSRSPLLKNLEEDPLLDCSSPKMAAKPSNMAENVSKMADNNFNMSVESSPPVSISKISLTEDGETKSMPNSTC